MLASSLPKQSSNKAAALIIVLAFVVLLAGVTLTYFTRTTSERQLAHSSYNDTSSDLMARNALDIITSNLQQEIVNGSSTVTPTPGTIIYVPTNAANMVPQKSGNIAGVANLIRRSVRNDSLTGNPGLPSLASQVNSTSDVSANGRYVTAARWNAHYLVPKKNTGTGDSIPIDAFANATPDWVFVTQAGPAVITQPSASVIGRYAYAVYDEGGLLDMNAAGYPSPTTILQYGRKGSLAFADLTALPGLSTTAVDNLVGWRDYASSQPSGTLSSNFSFTPSAANTYYNFILSDPTNIQLTNYFTGLPLTYFTNSFLAPSGAVTPSPSPGRTDQAFIDRQELIDLRSGVSSGISFSNALQSLGTFSREASANVPQWTPAVPDATNPNFQTLLVTSSFTRNDGSTANTGDPYVNKRFLLQRLNWLTYKGPSAARTIPTSAPALGDPNYDMWLLTRGTTVADMNSIRFGLTPAFLQQGTAANILKYFGLTWDATNERWNYTSPSGGSAASSIATLGSLTGVREPDFFELLQAGIINNSIGDAFTSDPGLPLTHQQSKILHILTIGANLIAQSRADSYPVRIACTVGGVPMEAVGMPRLPFLSSLAVCPAASNQSNGGVNWFLIPNLWDPFRDTWDLTEANASNALSTPGYLRPPVRITLQGTIGFGRATASQSGSVNPPSVFPFLTLSTINSSLTLKAGTTSPAGFGRDGLLEAKRLGVLDIDTSVSPLSSFVPTNSTNTGSSWNSIIRPANDTSTYRTDDFVVYRASIQGSQIPSGSPGLNPVLILPTGFQVTLDYQSPNGQWYSYSFLQGNNATNTWITASPNGLCLATSFSQYGSGSKPTIVNVIGGAQSLWTDVTGALAHSPIFAKADPRSIRYNSRIGVINVANPPLPFNSAGMIGSIWPSQYTTPPPMIPSAYPIPTPTPNPNPAIYSQLGDNGPAGSNPYSEAAPASETDFTHNDPVRPVMMNRPFRGVGEMGYAFRDQPFRTISFSSANSPDAGLLDLFTTNTYADSSGMRAGVINLNSAQAPALASVLTSTIRREDTPRTSGASPSPSPLASPPANSVATSLTLSTINNPLINRADLATLIANETGLGPSAPKTQRESIARGLGETVQTRTWNLLIDMIAQTGHYKPNASNLRNDFVVEGEEHYWVHVAIDRFTGRVIDKQLEKVLE